MKEEDRRREEEERRREQLFRAIEQLIYTAYLQALSLPAVRRAIEQKKDDFFFESNHTANRQVERVLGVMADRLNGLLLNGIRREWEFSKEVLEARVEAQLDPSTRDRMLRDRIRIDATQRSRLASADAFVREKQRDGLNLSGRVWNLAGNAKEEIEVILQNAIKEGRRGTEIAKDLRRFLIEPNKLFRRVRNKETGALELSAAAKAYHPGQGVYRSSYKNALRMARTELKAAQCEAAWQSAQTNPLIVGWEIRLSNNHTTLRDGKPCPFHDMCDELQGVYPKAFRFRGWHPHCRCEMLPIIARPSDRKELYRRIFKGDTKERASWSPRAVEEVPQVFTDWVEKNRERARGWRTVPRFITDNPAYIVGEYGRPKPRPVEVPPELKGPKKLSRFEGSFQQFADEVREKKRNIGKVMWIGALDSEIVADMHARGRLLETHDIVVLDKTILKYINHPKESKGATVAPDRYNEILKAINTPLHIYEDTNSTVLVYVYTHPYEPGRVVKVVVHPNFKHKGSVVNAAKSWGVVEAIQMDMKNYRKIK